VLVVASVLSCMAAHRPSRQPLQATVAKQQ